MLSDSHWVISGLAGSGGWLRYVSCKEFEGLSYNRHRRCALLNVGLYCQF